jgi:hypothetical protein
MKKSLEDTKPIEMKDKNCSTIIIVQSKSKKRRKVDDKKDITSVIFDDIWTTS